jgi:hypothetical protein
LVLFLFVRDLGCALEVARARLFYLLLLASTLFSSILAQAGSISFSISFTGDYVSITNTGSDAAFQVSEWMLDSTLQWRAVQVQQGNHAYLPPGQILKAHRVGRAPDTSLGRADPLFLVFFDQAGSRMAQLAWRQKPQVQPAPLETRRHHEQLVVEPSAAHSQKTVATFAVVMPYEGIQQLSKPLALNNAQPPNLIRHVWSTNTPMVVNTGAGQGGVWLVHEDASGGLRLQTVQDGVVRGQEQVPRWLIWIRLYFMQAAGVLAGVGLMVTAVGFVLKSRKLHRTGHAA